VTKAKSSCASPWPAGPFRGTELEPEPPVTPIGMGKQTRGVELAEPDDLDEAQLAAWMRQASTNPFAGGKKR
jgi:hypothetical protein